MGKKKGQGYGYKQGKFYPVNREKYKGKYPPFARSSWEMRAFMFIDRSSKIIKWSSESIIIPYKDPTRNNTTHRYFIDLSITFKKNGELKTYLIEIKPSSQTHPPKRGRKAEKTFLTESLTYTRNIAKWKAAKEFAARKGWEFIIWDEKSLRI